MTKFEISPTKYRELLDSIDLRLANLTRALGTIATDSLRVSVVDHFLPDADALRDLGSSTRRWRQGFLSALDVVGNARFGPEPMGTWAHLYTPDLITARLEVTSRDQSLTDPMIFRMHQWGSGAAEFFKPQGPTLILRETPGGGGGWFNRFDVQSNMTVTGNVGIGTTAPVVRLETQSPGGAPATSGTISTALFRISPSHTNSVTDFGAYTTTPFAGWLQQTDRTNLGVTYPLVLNPLGGNVGIGTAAQGGRLHVSGGKTIIGHSGQDYLPSGFNWNYTLQLDALDTSSIGFHDSGLSVSSIRYSNAGFTIGGDDGWGVRNVFMPGNVGIGTIAPGHRLHVEGNVAAHSFTTISDAALKTNIAPLNNSLAKILGLNGVSFNWKENNESTIGLIAQDVEKIFPEAVITNSGGLRSIDYARVTVALVEAMKEQQAQIEELNARIKKLEPR
ncbi:MAG: hypothetical protein DDT33_01774 [Firmicutes bacterium]|nr:hypothetical protein [Bacillota bacterium]